MTYGVRDELRFNKIKQYYVQPSGSEAEYLSPSSRRMLGKWQLIDPLPVKTKGFTPGIFRVNPVLLRKYTASCAPIDFYMPDVRNPGCNYHWVGDWSSCYVSQLTGISGTITGWKDSSAADRCKIKAYAKMKTPDSDLGVFFAELSETVEMLFNPLKGIRGLLNQMLNRTRKKGFRNLADSIKHLSNQWLEYRYGIMPAILDAQMLMKLFDYQIVKSKSPMYRSSARENIETLRESSSVIFYPDSYVTGWTTKQVVTTKFVVATVYYNCRAAQMSHGMSFYDAPMVAWEKIPFSFVVDWVWNVGDWLRASLPHPSTTPLGCSVSYVEDVLAVSAIEQLKHSRSTQLWPVPHAPYIEHRRTLMRELHTSLPPLPVVSAQILNLKRSLDAFSLTWRPLENGLRKLRKT